MTMREREIRYAEYVRSVSVHQNQLSFADLKRDPNQKIRMTSRQIYRILAPYTSVRLLEQIKAVFPLALYLMVFQMIILRQPVNDVVVICGGLVAVMVGLTLFMEGLKLGLMPFGETIGNILPMKSALPVVLIVAFLLGVGVTFAEPAIGALQQAGQLVDVVKAPYLYTLLNQRAELLVLVVGVGVGLAAVFGTMRFIFNWSLKPLIFISLVCALGLTGYIALTNPELIKIIGLAWDCGAVTTGPVTVPLVLSLGIGVASAVGNGESSLSGFGIVTLASLFPIIGVLGLGLYVAAETSPQAIIAAAQAGAGVAAVETAWWQQTPWSEVLMALRAIVPLVVFLYLVLKLLLRENLRQSFIVVYGIALTVLGMALFNVGLSYGLAKLGDQSGGLVPAAFAPIGAVGESPLYFYSLGLFIAVAFAWILGFGATLAEPALNALGLTVENLTNGAFKKALLMYSVSLGVATGIALGVCKLIFGFELAYVLIVGYLLLAVLTFFSTEEFVNVAWDSAGVTTGPVTVPLVLAMGLGFGNAVNVIEGFGILSMASLCPILSVLISGLYVQRSAKRARGRKLAAAMKES